MSAPFAYPAVPHARNHGPQGYTDYTSYRPWLRDEFSFRCVYCLFREQWGRIRGVYTLDHFLPVASIPGRPPTMIIFFMSAQVAIRPKEFARFQTLSFISLTLW